jgi:lipoprotein-anchoring transpeptidase ErfK/SrfK
VVAELSTRAPEGTPNALSVIATRADAQSRVWVEVRLPVLPNGTRAWVPRHSLGAYQTLDTRLVVDRSALRATLYRDGKPIFAAPVGVGTSYWPTPAGRFIVRSELTRYASPFYGPVAFGTSARSAVLTDWPDGGFVGIHGTNEPELIPGRVSHGCVRMRNSDIVRLAELMPVGTPILIR